VFTVYIQQWSLKQKIIVYFEANISLSKPQYYIKCSVSVKSSNFSQGLFKRAVLHKMCSSKPICAVLKTQMCSHQTNKIALEQSSHLLVTLVDAPENSRNAVIEHQKT
jgi:hypothetical protein